MLFNASVVVDAVDTIAVVVAFAAVVGVDVDDDVVVVDVDAAQHFLTQGWIYYFFRQQGAAK